MGPDSFNDCGSARICGRAAVTRVGAHVLLYTRGKLQQLWTERGAKPPQTLSDGRRPQMTTMDKCGSYGGRQPSGTTWMWDFAVSDPRIGGLEGGLDNGGQIAGVGRRPWDVTGA